MREIITKVYTFDELSDKAKERARDWYRQGALDYEWWDSVYEDAANIGLKITEFDLGRAQSINGEFIGTSEETLIKILKEHGKTSGTYEIALRYKESLKSIVIDEYYNETEDFENWEREFLHDLLEEYRAILQKEYEYLMSNKSVDEMIRANEYEFTEDGKRSI